MKALSRSEIWFGIIVAALFALAAFVMFGRAFTDSTFWLKLLTFTGCAIAISFVRNPLMKLDHVSRVICWFAIGVSAAVFISFGGELDFSISIAIGFGLGFVAFQFVADYLFRKSDSELP